MGCNETQPVPPGDCPVAHGGGCGPTPGSPLCTASDTGAADSGLAIQSLEGGGCSCAVQAGVGRGAFWLLAVLAVVAWRRRVVWAAVLLLFWSVPARALDANLLHTDDGGTFVSLLEGDAGPAWTPRMALAGTWVHQPVMRNGGGEVVPVVDDLRRAELGMSLPMGELVRMAFTVPLIWNVEYQGRDRGPFRGLARGAFSVHTDTARFAHAFQLDVTSARIESLAVDTLVADAGALGMTWAFQTTHRDLIFGGNVGASWRPPVVLESVVISEQLHYAGAVAWSPKPAVLTTLELFGRTPIADSTTRSGWPAELLFTMGGRTDSGWTVRGGPGVGLSKGIGAPRWRALVVVQRSPDVQADRDGDGYADLRDLCAGRAEDFDSFRDRDGCPDEDNDRDGIVDEVDHCPLDPETVNGLRDEDGCPDAFVPTFARVVVPPGVDSDGVWLRHAGPDGTVEQAPVVDDGWQKLTLPDGFWRFTAGGPGLMEDSTSLVVTPDKTNRVILRPARVTHGTLVVTLESAETGAPLEGDIAVVSETCPAGFEGTQASGTTMEVRLPVCAWRVEARADGRMSEARTVTIVEGEETHLALALRDAGVVVSGTEVHTGERLRFRLDSAELDEASGPWLDAVAAWLAERPDVQLLRVEGRADESGHPAYNLRLSQQRAESVVAALVARGVAEERLQPLGSGESHAERAAQPGAATDADRHVRLVLLIWDRDAG
mgnify:FL=1